MLTYLLLVLVEVISCLVYFDLWLVLKYKKHIFDSLLQLIPEKQRKVYQGVYRGSLLRK